MNCNHIPTIKHITIMKKYLFYLIAAAIVSVASTFCSKDESMFDLPEQKNDEKAGYIVTADLQNWWKQSHEGQTDTSNQGDGSPKCEGSNDELEVIEFQDGDDLTLRKRPDTKNKQEGCNTH